MSLLALLNPACDACRKRKRKCDRKRPACSRCIKAGWACPGYAAGLDPFRDETNAVVGKEQARHRRQQDHFIANVLATRPVQPSMEDRATCFFFRQYVSDDKARSSAPLRGVLEFVPPLYRQSSTSGALPAVAAAIGLAGLSNQGMSTNSRAVAASLHTKAIRQLAAAVADPIENKTDQTLAAIMLMCVYEFTVCERAGTMRTALDYHATAAINIINLRGPDQFKSADAVRLLVQFRTFICVNCYMKQTTLSIFSSDYIQWTKWASKFLRVDDEPFEELNRLVMPICAAMALLKEKPHITSLTLGALLIPLDHQLVVWCKNLPTEWMPISHQVSTSTNTDVGHDFTKYDTYTDLFMAQTWNFYRATRIIIHQTIMGTMIREGLERDTKEFMYSQSISEKEVEKVLDSAPYHFAQGTNGNSADILQFGRLVEDKVNPGFIALIWPLYIAAKSLGASTQQRSWAASTLRLIGITKGFGMAVALADDLCRRDRGVFFDSDAWNL